MDLIATVIDTHLEQLQEVEISCENGLAKTQLYFYNFGLINGHWAVAINGHIDGRWVCTEIFPEESGEKETLAGIKLIFHTEDLSVKIYHSPAEIRFRPIKI